MKQLARARKKVKNGKHFKGVLDWSYKHHAEKPQPVAHALSGDLLRFKSSQELSPTHPLTPLPWDKGEMWKGKTEETHGLR